jgi:hypothetical protein
MKAALDPLERMLPETVSHASHVEGARETPANETWMLAASGSVVAGALICCAFMLDAVGRGYPHDYVERICIGCHFLVGIAIGVAALGWVALPCLSAAGVGFSGLARTTACVIAVMIGAVTLMDRYVIGGWADTATAEQRKAAVQYTSLVEEVGGGYVRLDGLGIPPGILSSPSGRALAAFVPLAAKPGLALDRAVDELGKADVDRTIGTPAHVYDMVFIPSVRALKDSFNHYAAAQADFARDILAIPDSLAAQAKERCTTRACLHDPATLRNIASELRGKADASFAARIQAAFGEPMPPGLTFEEFVARPSIQAAWRQTLGAPTSAMLSPGMGFDAFTDKVYRPRAEAAAKRATAALTMEASAYGTGGKAEALGARAAHDVIRIPVFLLLSAVALVAHLCASAGYASSVFLPSRCRVGRFARVAALGLAASVFVLPSRLQATWPEWRTALADAPVPLAIAVRWIVEAQPAMFPVGQRLREMCLLGSDG